MSNNKILKLKEALNSKFFERQDAINGMLVALITGEPLILIGPPGTGKSAMAQSICESISGNYFSWLLTKFTVPEELFGPLSLKALEKDEYVRVTKGKLPDCNVAFLDEVGKASSSISNTLLTILNEKTFYNGDSQQKVPMRVLYGASNEVPQSEDLSAFYDRFVLKYFVDYVGDDKNIRSLLSGVNGVKMPKLTLKEIDDLSSQVDSVLFPDPIFDLVLQVKREIKANGIHVSDRKWVQAIRVIRGQSILNGHTNVLEEDLEILSSMLWSTPDQISKVKKIVNKIVNPVAEKVDSIVDALNEIKANNNSSTDYIEVYKKFRHAEKELRKLGEDNAKVKEALAMVVASGREIAKVHLNLED